MKVSIVHADTCVSDFWPGHHRPHITIPAYRQSFASVRRAIMSEIRQGAVMGADDDARLLSADQVRPSEEARANELTRKTYAAINRDIRPAVKGCRVAFPDVAADDECCAFFVIMIED